MIPPNHDRINPRDNPRAIYGIMKFNVSNPPDTFAPHRIRTNASEPHGRTFVPGRRITPALDIDGEPAASRPSVSGAEAPVEHCPGQRDSTPTRLATTSSPTRALSYRLPAGRLTGDQTAGTRSAQKGAYSMAPLRKISLGVTPVGESPAATIACALNARAAQLSRCSTGSTP